MLYLFLLLRYTTAKKLDTLGSYYSMIYIHHGKQENAIWIGAVEEKKEKYDSSSTALGKNLVKKRRREKNRKEEVKRIMMICSILL